MRSLLLLFALLIALVGCGGSGGGSNGGGSTGTLSIVPSAVTLAPNEEAVFSAAGASGVTWSVVEAGGGTISSTGRYKAPSTVGTYHVAAAGGGRSAQATVTVTDGAFVVLTPLQATVAAGETFKFTAEVRNGTGTPTFSVVEADGGTVAQDGAYTPPSTPGTYHVRVELPTNPSSRTEATITVTGAVSISIADGPRLASPGSRITFVASITGNEDTEVAWSTSAGTIDETGKLIAPDAAGEVTVTATSVVSPSKKATAVVKVIENPTVRFKFAGKADIVLKLDTDKAPDTSANLVSLVNEKFYERRTI
ncbi:hypothetical protein EON81_08010 [bacterium]|nr:MAG: hypothetical protein EON81_08010 [bacterium]